MKGFSIAAIVMACLLLLSLQTRASAHAFLDHAEPKVGAEITQPPADVKIWFTQELEAPFSSIQVLDSNGNEVDKKDSHVDSQTKNELIVTTPQLPAGTYKVVWSVVSVDTHKTHGDFKFTIKPPN